MTNKEKYVRAAEILANAQTSDKLFCCHVLRYDLKMDTENFTKTFEPHEDAYSFYGDPYNSENKLARSLALLFMAEMSKK